MTKERNHFKLKIVGSGDGTTLEDVLYSISDLILETVTEASRVYGTVNEVDDIMNSTLIDGWTKSDHFVDRKGFPKSIR